MDLLIRRSGTLIDVSPDGRSPLPPDIVQTLAPQLMYQHKQTLHGAAAYDYATGRRQSVHIEPRNMFRMEEGRLTTGYGFIPRIHNTLTALGHTLRFIDVSPPRRRPLCYTPDWDTVLRTIQFRPRQVDCLQAIADSPGGLINATMGFGKTFLFYALCVLFPHAKFAIVIDGVDVAHRIVRHLTRYLPNIGLVGDGHRSFGRITVYTAGSMEHCDGDVDFLLCDEAHKLMSAVHSANLGKVFRFTRNYMFSGTMYGRLDGAHAMLEMFAGPEIFRMTYQDAVALGLVVPIKVRWLPIVMDHNPAANKTGVPKMRWGIWRNEFRHQAIANDVRANYTNNEQILISVATVDHAVSLWRHLPEFELCYSQLDPEELENYKRSNLLPPNFREMTPARRDEMREGFERGTLRRVIATDVWSTGVDFEALQVLYRADARSSETLDGQWPTRTSRISNGKENSEIVDCIDYFDSTLRGKSQARKRHYDAYGWEQDWPRGRRQINNAL